jgi:hypothetical protein
MAQRPLGNSVSKVAKEACRRPPLARQAKLGYLAGRTVRIHTPGGQSKCSLTDCSINDMTQSTL